MQKPERIPRSRAETCKALSAQVKLLAHYAEQYDAGMIEMALPMSNSLRLLLHQTKHSQSLLDQLGLRRGRYFAAARRLTPGNLATECKLVVVQVGGTQGVQYLPYTAPMSLRARLAFPEWWGSPVLKGYGGTTMSRLDVVTAMADTDGGSHVDPGLGKVYSAFRSGQLLGWMRVNDQGGFALQINATAPDVPPPILMAGQYVPDPQYACIRTIAHEVLLTLQKQAPWSLSAPYEPKNPIGPPQ